MLTMGDAKFRELIPLCDNYGVTIGRNHFAIKGTIAYIGLTQGRVCLIDAADLVLIEDKRWYAHKDKNTYYANSRNNGDTLVMHRLICPDYRMIDHGNRNGLDNRRENLRNTNHSLNGLNRKMQKNNTSGYQGVVKSGNGWRAQTRVLGKHTNIGFYETAEEAHEAFVRFNLSRPAPGTGLAKENDMKGDNNGKVS
jgi:hypothetical protein